MTRRKAQELPEKPRTYNRENIKRYRQSWKILTVRLHCFEKLKAMRRTLPTGKRESLGDVVERLIAAREMLF